MKITIIGGCGRLGLSMAVVSAQAGHHVVCADIDRDAVDLVNSGQSPISENGVAEALADFQKQAPIVGADGSIIATTEIQGACKGAELIFVVVPTPSEPTGGAFSISLVLLACETIGRALLFDGESKSTIVLVSTVNPGDCESHIVPMLEHNSRKKAGVDFGFAYSPEFIRQGSIMRDFRNPDLVLIGAIHSPLRFIVDYYNSVLENNPPLKIMSIIDAEITKLGLNTALVAKLAMANQITWLCHKIKGADAEVVLEAIGQDKRIGTAFFKPGLPPGGPCLPRDAAAFDQTSNLVGVASGWTRAVNYASRFEIGLLVQEIERLIGDEGKTAILGMTYKPGVDIETMSAGSRLNRALFARGHKMTLVAYDPLRDESKAFAHVIDLADVLVITTPHQQFQELRMMDLSGKVVFDCWGILDAEYLNCAKYIRLGRGE